MKTITKKVHVPVPKKLAFDLFVNRLTNWWPKEYTWSQNKLVEITIDVEPDGLCTETGPFGFRCDWGRITSISRNDTISLKWQISPQRVPVPDPDQASDLIIHFNEPPEGGTDVHLQHLHFERHGEGSEAYATAMDSEKGWDYILQCYTTFTSLQQA